MWLNDDEEEEDVSDAGFEKSKSDYGKFMESEKGICACVVRVISRLILKWEMFRNPDIIH